MATASNESMTPDGRSAAATHVVLPHKGRLTSYQLEGDRTTLVAPLEPEIRWPMGPYVSVSGDAAVIGRSDGFSSYDLATGELIASRPIPVRAGNVILDGDKVFIGMGDRILVYSVTEDRSPVSIALSAPLACMRLAEHVLHIRYMREVRFSDRLHCFGHPVGTGGASHAGQYPVPPSPPARQYPPIAATFDLTSEEFVAAWQRGEPATLVAADGEPFERGFVAYDRNQEAVAILSQLPTGAFVSPSVVLEVFDAKTGARLFEQRWEEQTFSYGDMGLEPGPDGLHPRGVTLVGRTIFLTDDRGAVHGARIDDVLNEPKPKPDDLLGPKKKRSWLQRLLGSEPPRRGLSQEGWAAAARAHELRERNRWRPVELPFRGAATNIVAVQDPERAFVIVSGKVPRWARISPVDFSVVEQDGSG